MLVNVPERANAISAVAGAFIALMAVVISVISLVVSIFALRHQNKHNVLSVTPLPEVTVADYENSIRVKLRNNGSGPMVVKSVSVSNETDVRASIIEWMPDLPNQRPWTAFSRSLVNRSLLPGGELKMLELTQWESEQNFASCRDLCRKALCNLTVIVEYTDIYKSKFQPHSQSLGWFGRHWPA